MNGTPAAFPLAPDGFFLSATNPIATADQIAMERLAIALMEEPGIRAATAEAAQRFRILAGHDFPQQARDELDTLMIEWAFHYVLLAINSDPNHPRVLGSFFGPPHRWFGLDVPGCRGPGTAENPDNHYTVIPIDPQARFALHGRRQDAAIGDCPFHLTSNLSQGQNLVTLHWRDIVFDGDGGFTVTIDPDPADGRTNHLRTDPDCRWLFVRDCRLDWSEKPNAYRIERLDPPAAPPLTHDQIVLRAARWIVDDAPMNWWFRQMIAFVDTNGVTQPAGSAVFSGQPAQRLSRGRLDIAEDEAFLLEVQPGDFHYHNVSLNNFWEMTPAFWRSTSSLNNRQSIADADGVHRIVLAARDPGVHNWIDMQGLREALFLIRFQDHRAEAGRGEPWVRGQVVRLDVLDAVLPASTRRAGPEERARQLAERLRQFEARYAE